MKFLLTFLSVILISLSGLAKGSDHTHEWSCSMADLKSGKFSNPVTLVAGEKSTKFAQNSQFVAYAQKTGKDYLVIIVRDKQGEEFVRIEFEDPVLRYDKDGLRNQVIVKNTSFGCQKFYK